MKVQDLEQQEKKENETNSISYEKSSEREMHNSPNKPDQKWDEINIKIKNENTGNQLIEDRLTEEIIKDTKDKIDKSNKVENNTNFKNNGNQVNNNNLIQEEVKDIQTKLDKFILLIIWIWKIFPKMFVKLFA